MSRPSDPWFRKSKNTWYLWHEGKQVSLGIKGKSNRREAIASWHKLLAEKPIKPETTISLQDITESFLADAKLRLKPPTLRLYRNHLAQLCDAVADLNELTPAFLTQWLAALSYNSTTKAIMLRSISACLGWSVRQGLILHNIAKNVTKPKTKSRSCDAIITEHQHQQMLALATAEFKPLLIFLHDTGCRPGEACAATSSSFDASSGVIILKEHKSSRYGKDRLIFLTPAICKLMKAQTELYGSGNLFPTARGKPWTSCLINQQVRRLAKKCGFMAMPYGYRHGFATAALSNGIPDAHVAALLGHSSTAILHKHYSHLTSNAGILKQAAGLIFTRGKNEQG